MSERVCECEFDSGLFVWRGDPEWWSCMACDGRVRPLTEPEKAKRHFEAVQKKIREQKEAGT